MCPKRAENATHLSMPSNQKPHKKRIRDCFWHANATQKHQTSVYNKQNAIRWFEIADNMG